MEKIASPQELTSEIKRLLAYVRNTEHPQRAYVASELHGLAGRVAARGGKDLVQHIDAVHKSMGDLINHWQDERNDRLDGENAAALKKPFADLKSALDDVMDSLNKAHNIAKSKIGVRA
jgi:hypothetical protein